jgi:hypothetical protein
MQTVSGDISVGDTLEFLIRGDEYWNSQPLTNVLVSDSA